MYSLTTQTNVEGFQILKSMIKMQTGVDSFAFLMHRNNKLFCC